MKEQIKPAYLIESLTDQVDEAELYEVRSYELPVRFQAGALASLRSVETAGRALRVVREGRLGFSTTTDMTDGTTLVQNALDSAQFGDPVAFQFPTQSASAAVRCFDAKVEQLDESQLITLGEEVVEKLNAYDAELQIEISLNKQIEDVRLLNTRGLTLEDRRTTLSLSVEILRAQDDDVLVLWRSATSRRLEDVKGQELAEHLIERLRWSENIATVASKPMPVIFDGDGVLVPLLPLIPGLSGRQVYMKTSPLSEKLGQPVFDSRLTVIDDGCLDLGVRSAPFDDEGVPTTRKTLIEEGSVRRFLYDLKTAAQARTQTTGNGFKSGGLFGGGGFRQRPSVAPANWLIPPGDQSLEQILKGLDEALLVEGVLGLGQGNVDAGEFSNNVAIGFLVRRGEVVGRIKNTMIAGNAYELLKDHLIALGDRAQWVYGMLHAPAIAVDGVGVASKT